MIQTKKNMLLAALTVTYSHIQAAPMNPPLYKAAEAGNLKEVRELIEQGADPNTTGEDKVSVLEIAANRKHLDVVQFLLEKGAKVDYKDAVSGTPLLLAVSGGDVQIVKVLLEHGAKVDEAGALEMTPLAVAATSGNMEVFNLLLKNGANVDARFSQRNTILMAAITNNKDAPAIVRAIIKLRPSSVHDRNENGQTPVSLAETGVRVNKNPQAKAVFQEIEKILRDAGAVH